MSVPVNSPQPPAEVVRLAEARMQARASKDYAASDDLRRQITDAGWLVKDTPDGYSLSERPPYDSLATVADIPRGAISTVADCVVGIIVDGWADDVRACVEALLANTAAFVVLLDNASDAGSAVHELARANPQRIAEFHVERAGGWAACTTALISAHSARVHVSMDISSIVDGDALTPLSAAIQGDVVAAGWQGADVDLDDQWRSVVAAGPGEVDVLLGYLMAVDRATAEASPPHPKATFYRNADVEWSLRLRAAGGRLVVPLADLPVHQERHHGYHDSDPDMRDRASKKNYDRILAEFRNQPQILRPRA